VRELRRELSAEVVALPFFQAPTRQERARALYHDALGRFDRDLHDHDDSTIALLEDAILLDPHFEDAFESLGVILNRHHRVDEAIQAMEVLSRLNPKSVMAHTNLSVFYMKKGNLEKAEEEKAIAKLMETQQVVDREQAEAAGEAERRRIEFEARDRIRMFQEVLEIDPDDPLATFGLGSAYLQLQQYAAAVPFLERATEVQKDYSAAYLSLGKCLEFLGDAVRAQDAYARGIAVASRKGDLMPMREMERRLKALHANHN
jgi:predicted Zn-dependent protease